MKKAINILPDEYNEGKKATIENIKNILSHHKDISMEDIQSVGILESGKLQLKAKQTISNRQIIALIGYLMWFWDISQEDLK